MSSDSGTVDLQTAVGESDTLAGGRWSETVAPPPQTVRKTSVFSPAAAVLTWAIVVGTAATAPAASYVERLCRVPSPASLAFEHRVGRRVSRAEALRSARRILERAERERLEIAQWEAEHSIQLEDEE